MELNVGDRIKIIDSNEFPSLLFSFLIGKKGTIIIKYEVIDMYGIYFDHLSDENAHICKTYFPTKTYKNGYEISIYSQYVEKISGVPDSKTQKTEEGFITDPENWKNGLDLL